MAPRKEIETKQQRPGQSPTPIQSGEDARTDVNKGDVRATVAESEIPRPSNPQTYDGGEPLIAGGQTYNTVVDNTPPEDAPEPAPRYATPTVTVEPARVEAPKHEMLDGARIRLTRKSYIGDVLYEAGAEIDSYSGPKGPHMEVLDAKKK